MDYYPPCHACGGLLTRCWVNKVSEIKRDRCQPCGAVREIDGSEFGKFVLGQIERDRASFVHPVERKVCGLLHGKVDEAREALDAP